MEGKKNGLFILMGECFRQAMAATRTRDTPQGIKNQKESSQSHVKLIERLQSENYNIDIAINTYDTVNDKLLLEYYNTINIIYVNFTKDRYTCEKDAAEWSVKNTLSKVDKDNYEFIFLLRVDLLLKADLIKIFDPRWNTITFPNVMFIDEGMDYPNIATLFCFIPKKYFNPFDKWHGLIHNAHHLFHHHSGMSLMMSGLTLKDIGFATDLLYIANTVQMTNPLYAINCRPEGPTFVRGYTNRKYIKDKHIIVDI